AHVRRAGAHLRARTAADRGRCAGDPRSPQHGGDVEGAGGQVPFALDQLLAPRAPPQRARADDRCGREGRLRGMRGHLVLEDGAAFAGEMVGAEAMALGEAVFTTAMSGYQEIVTDPSFCGQIVCFTAPMIGNYGVAASRCESEGVHARGVIMRE